MCCFVIALNMHMVFQSQVSSVLVEQKCIPAKSYISLHTFHDNLSKVCRWDVWKTIFQLTDSPTHVRVGQWRNNRDWTSRPGH